jgi:hypothetical protein
MMGFNECFFLDGERVWGLCSLGSICGLGLSVQDIVESLQAVHTTNFPLDDPVQRTCD